MSDSTTLVYKKKKKKFKIFPLVNAIFFIIVACLIMIPIYRVIISSIDANTSYNFVWLPSKFTWGGYTAVLTRSSLYTPFLISVVTTIIGTFVGLLVVTLGGYVLIQWEMPGRNFFAYMLLFTMIFDGGMIPKYLVIKQLGLMNTLWAVILPMSINVYNLVLMRNFFKIVLPLSKAALASIGLMFAVSFWNDYTNFKLYITKNKLFNFQIQLRNMVIDSDIPVDDAVNQETIGNAATIIAILPFMIIYPFCQKYFVQGVNVGAVKE